MSETVYHSTNDLRTQFTQALSEMYKKEVPQYDSLCSLIDTIHFDNSNNGSFPTNIDEQLEFERHGAIRLGSSYELSIIRRIFAVMGMYSVDYYDLSVAGIPVHSTAFRPIDLNSLNDSPFRVFTSLLRLDLINDDDLKRSAKRILSGRNIFSSNLLSMLDDFEVQGGLTHDQSKQFITLTLDVFRWHQDAQVDRVTYQSLNSTHRLIADVVCFKGPHINHLTRCCLNIDKLQEELSNHGFQAKAIIEGPPKRKFPILLRQTSFLALEEKVIFSDGENGKHKARFGEVEHRGVALTPKGRLLYDKLLNQARSNSDSDISFQQALEKEFKKFPDNQRELHDKKLAYYQYIIEPEADVSFKSNSLKELLDHHILKIVPILYEDFLPVSAAGIFSSNLSTSSGEDSITNMEVIQNNNQTSFEDDLGCPVLNSFKLYEKIQKESLSLALATFGIEQVI